MVDVSGEVFTLSNVIQLTTSVIGGVATYLLARINTTLKNMATQIMRQANYMRRLDKRLYRVEMHLWPQDVKPDLFDDDGTDIQI